MGLSSSALSRNVGALGEYRQGGEPGLLFVDAKVDPRERRRKFLNLTGKGRSFLRSLLG